MISTAAKMFGRKITVIATHGICGYSWNMLRIKYALHQHDINVKLYSYSSLSTNLDTLGKQFAKYIQQEVSEHPDHEFHFVTHSMGSLVLRSAINHSEFPRKRVFSDQEQICRIILIAPPSGGSSLAKVVHDNILVRYSLKKHFHHLMHGRLFANDTSLRQNALFELMENGTEYFKEEFPFRALNGEHYKIHVIAVDSSRGWTKFIQNPWLDPTKPNDRIVTVEETMLELDDQEGIDLQNTTMYGDHAMILASKELSDHISNIILSNEFRSIELPDHKIETPENTNSS
jgi:pimeloyl-ACP methyl ester carboxylesterase